LEGLSNKIKIDQFLPVFMEIFTKEITNMTLAERRSFVSQIWAQGIQKPQEIAEISGLPVSTVYRYVAKLQKTGSLSPTGRAGRPTILSPKKRRHLGRIASLKKFTSASEIAATLEKKHPGLSVSERTIQRELRKLKYQVCRPLRVPLLTETQVARRLEWALAHSQDSWNHTIFSDETTFQLFRNTELVRYKVGEARPHRPVVKHPYKVHLWAAFSRKGPIGFHLFTGIMNAQIYCQILTAHLFPNASEAGRQWRFQQDNCPIHTAKITSSLLERRHTRVLDWPSNSPDLNPIENLWAILKNKVEKRVNLWIYEKKKISVTQFQTLIRQEWDALDPRIMTSLVDSMPDRLEEVIRLQGKKTKY
jgi:transposase